MEQLSRWGDAAHLLLTMPWGIGDTVSVGLSAIDQIRQNDPAGMVKIDILCNRLQAELLENDPRINRLIQVDPELFPTREDGTWKRGLILPRPTVKLVEFLRNQRYTAVLPFLFSPAFFYQLHTPVMFLSLREIWHFMAVLQTGGGIPIPALIRKAVNKWFGDQLPEPSGHEPIPSYIRPEHIQNAAWKMACLRAQVDSSHEQSKVLIVAPDTSSEVTRPPTTLLAEGIAGALKHSRDLLVVILPSYADTGASTNLLQALAPAFHGRVVLAPAEPKMPLPELASFVDQADLLVAGDTGVTHLAIATKKVQNAGSPTCHPYYPRYPRNATRIIELFGGTNPGLYGYGERTCILGKGRKEQRAIVPGVAKDIYHPKGRNLFDHIAPQQLTEAIMSRFLPPSSHPYPISARTVVQ